VSFFVCYFQPSVDNEIDPGKVKVCKPPGRRQRKPVVLPGTPLTKIRIFFASQTGTSKVPRLTVATSTFQWETVPFYYHSHASLLIGANVSMLVGSLDL